MSQTNAWVWTGLAAVCAAVSVHASDLVDHPARLSSRDVKIPKPLVRKIEEDYRAFLVKMELPAKESLKRKLLNVSAELVQKRGSALHENVRVTAPVGGGVIDLQEFVAPVRGGFMTKILATTEAGTEPPDLHVVFVSKAKTRNIDGEDFGAGCDKYMDISAFYQKKMAKGGFEVYTADQRYVSVLGGTFVLYAFEKEALYVGSLTFMDSRFPHLLCED